MPLPDAVERAFEAGGPLTRCAAFRFSVRAGQTAMARAVARTLQDGGALVVEAGTGVGKTFGYLVPALLSGQRILLSTATKTLQDQLYVRDIPRLSAALGVVVRTALLKGRSSYLCLHRLGLARQDAETSTAQAQRDMAQVEAWSASTRMGDLAELLELDERSAVIPLVTSTRENCLGSRCPEIHTCHVNLARREAMAADVVVVNHHLFFADIHIRESGVAELLPSVHAVVFDEAHQLNEIGIGFLGHHLSAAQLDTLCRDLAAQGSLLALGCADWRAMLAAVQTSVAVLRTVCADGAPSGRRAWHADEPDGITAHTWQAMLAALHAALQQAEGVLRSIDGASAELTVLRERTSRLMGDLDRFSHPLAVGQVRWLETGRQPRLVQSPLDIAHAMQTRVMATDGQTQCQKSWIFTSATLGHEASMADFVRSCGLQDAQVLQVESPFDYAAQAALYVPQHLPKPGDSSHSTAVAGLVAQGARQLGGRTLVLTTTLRAMRRIADDLRAHFSKDGAMRVLVQGELPKRELVQRLCEGGGGAPGCILVACASFWEGVDVPGDALQMVVIDKLPFAPPDDPLVQARTRELQKSGKNPFQYLHVPQAAIALKQGAGRLIRSETDRGILVVCDVRLVQMGYGRRILKALPAMQYLANLQQFEQALITLTRPSTMDRWMP